MAEDKSKAYASLTPKQQDFVEYYLVSLNATEAATRAGYSPATADVQGSKLLRNPKVMAVIEERRKAKAEEIHLEQDAVLAEVAAILFTRIDEVCDWSSGDEMIVKNLDDIPVHARKAIKKITKKKSRRENDTSSNEEWVWAVEMHDKMRAAEFMGRYFGMLESKGDGDAGKPGTAPGAAAARGRRILDSIRAVRNKAGGTGSEGESL